MNHDPVVGDMSQPTSIDASESNSSVGALLRASRLRVGEDLDEVAAILRLRPRQLEAIEEGRHHELPGTTYALGFVRAYADHLGLDSDEVVRRFKDEVTPTGKPSKPDLVFPEPLTEGGVPKGAVIFVGLFIALLAYGGWYLKSVDNDFFKEWVAPLPDRLAALVGQGPESDASAENAQAADTQAADTQAADTPEAAGAVPAISEQVAEVAEAVVTEAVAEPPATETPATETPATEALAAERGAAEVTGDRAASEGAAGNASEGAEGGTLVEADAAGEQALGQDGEAAEAASASEESNAAESAPAASPDSAAQISVTGLADVETAAPEGAAEPGGADAASGESLAEPDQTTPTDAAEPAPAPAADGAAAAAGPAVVSTRVRFDAVADSWIEIIDVASGRRLEGRLLRDGDVFFVPDRPGLVLVSGNAGGLKITVDGAPVEPVGGSGDVVRNVSLAPDDLTGRGPGDPVVRIQPKPREPRPAPKPAAESSQPATQPATQPASEAPPSSGIGDGADSGTAPDALEAGAEGQTSALPDDQGAAEPAEAPFALWEEEATGG